MTDEIKITTPPYASTKSLDLFFGKIRRIRPPVVNSKWVKDNQIPFPDAIVSAMKFLGVVDANGVPTEEFAQLRQEGAPFSAALQRAVTRGYAAVFAQIEDLSQADESDINNAFRSAYDVGNPQRYVAPFLHLCRMADVPVPGPTAKRREISQSAPRNRGSNATPEAPRISSSQRRAAERGKVPVDPHPVSVRLDVPWDASEDEIFERLDRLRKAMDKVFGA